MKSSQKLSAGERQYEFLDREYKKIIGFWGNVQQIENNMPGARYSFAVIFLLLSVTTIISTHFQFNVSSSIKWVLIPLCAMPLALFLIAGRKITSISRKSVYGKYGGERFDCKKVQFPFVYYYSVFVDKIDAGCIDIQSVRAYISARIALKKDNDLSKMFASIGVNFLFMLIGMVIGNLKMGDVHTASLLIQIFAINTLLLSPLFAVTQCKWDRMRVIYQYLRWMHDDSQITNTTI
ncbi:hypothetical protein [uncultured Pseudodesulfovibrio sp.]|uniref:hypothetical protein n=1 Tax=uncultured Pseudodesulfovibrio sp. TaxID=2035858 RepID=UPI0029C73595|nr:hypothetical protein [uncultured Pseudodesulfovibrio sp.]